ncbi:alpha/beta hydrolase [Nostoc sp. 3335mG]|nr:alpha/beta hydrolase [Nostoc sp. 3335mG]
MDTNFVPRYPQSLVVLPGLLCDSRMFDLSGFPNARVIDGFYAGANRIEAMADHALARLPASFALLGHSMGARVALEIWRKAPRRVARLALVDTGVHPVRDGERDGRYRLRDLGRSHGMAALVDAWLPPMMGDAAREDAALMDRLRGMAISAGIDTFEAQIEGLLNRPALDALLPTIDCPVLVAVGREDRWSPVEQHEAIAAAIPHATLQVVDGAGHMMPAEQPSAFARIVRDWLNQPAVH